MQASTGSSRLPCRRSADRGLEDAVGRGLVRAESLERGRPELPHPGHLEVLDLAHELGTDPPGPFHRRQLGVVDRRLGLLQVAQPLEEVAQDAIGEPGPDLADPDQLTVTIRAEQERAERGPARPGPRRPPQDQAVLLVGGLDLAPVLGPPAGDVRAPQALGHDPLEPELFRRLEERGALAVHHERRGNRARDGDDVLPRSSAATISPSITAWRALTNRARLSSSG